MNNDILLKVAKYLPKKMLIQFLDAQILSSIDTLIQIKWQNIIEKSNIISSQRQHLIYKLLLENGYKKLAAELASHTAPMKKLRLISYFSKTSEKKINDEIIEILISEELYESAIVKSIRRINL